MDVKTFQISAAVIHDVPRPDQEEELLLTDAPVPLDNQLKSYLRRKIVESLEQRGLEVIADAEASPVIRDAVAEVIANHEQLVDASKQIALHLNDSQNRRNTAGLLIVLTGTVDDSAAVAVLKLEREQGLRLRIQSGGGQNLVDLEFLRDLTLTDKTKIFKTSLSNWSRLVSPNRCSGASRMISGGGTTVPGSPPSSSRPSWVASSGRTRPRRRWTLWLPRRLL